ncbi:MAG: NnrS family protein [Xanthobacteraceae bacterium]|nr:MAG: NnrS family protein [Xanthobacteraceae bacterium]
MDALPRRRAYSGPVFLSGGFRPFFLFAGLYAAVVMAAWLPLYTGAISLPLRFAPLDWHAHELLFGTVAATVAGFLLTAIPNWTGRLPIQGTPLAVLVLTWLAGRIVMWFSGALPAVVVAVIDLAFLVLLAAAAGREIVAGKNWRNLRVLGPLTVLIAANVCWHVEVARAGSGEYSRRLAIAAVIMLIMLIGGRIVPSFTRNVLARTKGRLPVPFDRFDGVAMAAGIVALLAWVALPLHVATGALLVLAAGLHIGRLARWAGDRTTHDALLLILHVAYAFVPIGFLLNGLTAFTPMVAASAGIHAWTAGAMGAMTLAVMSRASLGHTGQALRADARLQAVYVCVVGAALVRIAAALIPTAAFPLYDVAAAAWVLAYLGFAVLFAPLLLARR